MNKAENARIFLGPYEVAGYSCNLSEGLKQIGTNVRFIDLWDHPYNYGGNDNGNLENILRYFKKSYYRHTKRTPVRKLVFGVFNILFTIIIFLKALILYDVFIFIFGFSLLPGNLDLPVLRLFGKRIIFNIALGSEARPPYMNGVYQSKDGSAGFDLKVIFKLAAKIKKKVSRIESWSNIVIGSPFSTSQFTEKKFVNYFSLGFPRKHYEHRKSATSGSVCRILHSPSHPAAKGTKIIKETIDALVNKGYELEFILLQNKSNREVLDELLKCDFVIDQLYSDTPLAGFACEAAVFGKPAVVGSYAVDEFEKYISGDMMPPSFLCRPENLQSAVERMITDRQGRDQLGSAAGTFIEDAWSSESVAGRFSSLIKGEVPEEFWVDPLKTEYFYGAGQPESRTREIITALVEKFGTSSLCLGHNPGFEKKVMEFAGISSD